MRLLSRLVLAAGVIAPPLHAQGTPGFYVETRVTSRYEGERAAARPGPREWRERRWSAAGSTRMEGMPMPLDSSNTTYTVTRAGNRSAYLITPSTRTVRVATFDEMQHFLTDEIGPPLAGERLYKDLGDGGLILGHRTRKFEMRTSYRLPTALGGPGGEGRSRPITMTLWYAYDTTDALVAAWLRQASAAPGKIAPQVPRGMLLRSESRSDGTGVPRLGVREVQVWRQERLDTALFAVPSDYTRIKMVDEFRVRREESTVRLAAQRAAFAEMNRLRASTDPADKRKLDRMMDSVLKALKQSAAERPPVNLRDGAIVITDSAKRRKP